MSKENTGKAKTAIIIGAGPAGLTAAYELLSRTDYVPVVLESNKQVGGLAKTVRCRRGLLDIGGHRFFTKSNRVLSWWLNILPPTKRNQKIVFSFFPTKFKIPDFLKKLPYSRKSASLLPRNRISRIMYENNFFDYPPKLNILTFRQLGLVRSIQIIISYARSKVLPSMPENSLEDFFINRFGRKLYSIFFKSYTEKVWGKKCESIHASWGRQRIRGVSLSKVLLNAFYWKSKRTIEDVETSLTDRFLYPAKGPGQLWEVVEKRIVESGGTIRKKEKVVGIQVVDKRIHSVTVANVETGQEYTSEVDVIFSSMPLKDLFEAIRSRSDEVDLPNTVYETGSTLEYRDFISVGVALHKKTVMGRIENKLAHNLRDNWIYVQNSNVLVGRIQLLHNWSPYMATDKDTLWLGMEYFCSENDDIWKMADEVIGHKAALELETLGFAKNEDVIETYVVRAEKAYPGYFGDSYRKFEILREYIGSIENLYPIGRNGMHRYNNQDHSMLTAMIAVDSLLGKRRRDDVWLVNEEEDYHEKR